MYTAFLCSDYYDSSAPLWQPTLATSAPAGCFSQRGHHNGSHVHFQPLVGLGVQLCPCSFAAATPQIFTVASRSATLTDLGVPPDTLSKVRAAAPPTSVRLERVVSS
jgi:hypothetical protein